MILYRVTVRRVYEALVLAPDAATAEGLALDASDLEPNPPSHIDVESATADMSTVPDEWEKYCLVYHPGDGPITVTEARRRSDL